MRHPSLLPVFLLLVTACAPEGTREPSPAMPSIEAAGASTTWIRTFAGPDYGAFFDVARTTDGGVLAVGATNHLHVAPYSGDALFIKLTLEGDVMWERTWGGDGYEQAISVEADESGGYIVFGETDSYGAGDRDFFLLTLDENGTEEGFRTYGRARREWPYGMLRLSNRDLLIYGFSEAVDGSGRSQYAVRVTPNGDVVWEYVGGVAGEELVLDALETENGDLVLAVAAEEDGELVSLDPDGHVRWANRYDLPGWQYGSQLAFGDEGGFLLAGFSMNSGPPRQADTWLAHCDSTGELEWETSFGDPAFDDYATSLIGLNDGTYLTGHIANGLLLRRVDGRGEVLWTRSLVGQTVYGAMALVELDEGGYLVAGLSELVGGRSYDAVILRTDAEGRVAE